MDLALDRRKPIIGTHQEGDVTTNLALSLASVERLESDMSGGERRKTVTLARFCLADEAQGRNDERVISAVSNIEGQLIK